MCVILLYFPYFIFFFRLPTFGLNEDDQYVIKNEESGDNEKDEKALDFDAINSEPINMPAITVINSVLFC